MYLFLETMESSQSQVLKDNSDEAIMRNIASKKGPARVIKYIKNNTNRWKNEPLKFGIVGGPVSGKSSFVNLVRNVSKGDEEYAQVGRGNTTRRPTKYFDPDNRRIEYWDLPGCGTLMFPRYNYINEMRLQEYDYFLVFFERILTENDLWIVEQLVEMKKTILSSPYTCRSRRRKRNCPRNRRKNRPCEFKDQNIAID